MRLHKLTVHNWFSYKHAVLPLDNQGVVLVSAENGRGKSCLFSDAIPWCLFGQTVREKVFDKTSQDFKMDDVVNNKQKKDCCVQLEFTGVDGQHYTVNRYRKDSQYGNTVVLCQINNGKTVIKNLAGENTKETDEKIRKLTGMTYETYCNSVVFAQGAVRRFTQCTDAQRREIFEQFFDLDVFNKAREFVATDKKHLQQSVADFESEKREHSAVIASNESRLRGIKGTLDATRDELKKLAVKKDDSKQLVKLQNALDSCDADRKMKQEELAELRLNLLSKDKADALRTSLTKFTDMYQDSKRSIKIREKEITELCDRRDKFKKGSECPECLRPMLEHDLKMYQQHLQERIAANQMVLASLEPDSKKLGKKVTELSATLEKYNNIRSDCTNVQEAIYVLNNERVNINNDFSIMSSMQRDREHEKSKYESEISRLEKTLASEEHATDKHRERVKEIDASLLDLKEDIEKLDFWLEGFSNYGIKDFCYSRLVGVLNHKLSHYSQTLTNGEIDVQFAKESGDKIKVSVNCRNGADKYILSSNGQERRVDLCIAMAFQSIVESGAQPVNLSIIDEFDSGLDAEGLNKLEQHIKDEAKRKGSIFLITHNPQLAGQFDNLIQINQDKHGYSTLVGVV
jgi:DNA repair exonuclease SbcCD ATPase subunit